MLLPNLLPDGQYACGEYLFSRKDKGLLSKIQRLSDVLIPPPAL
jgi:hypothetical protein